MPLGDRILFEVEKFFDGSKWTSTIAHRVSFHGQDVDAGRETVCIPIEFVIPGFNRALKNCANKLPKNIVDSKGHFAVHRQCKSEDSRTIEWVWIVLIELVVLGND